MHFFTITLLLLVPIALVYAAPDPKATKNTDKPIVTTKSGKVQGSILASRKGKQIFAYRGVPYAKPPINELRFQAPVPVDPWGESVLNATEDAPLCPQHTASTTSENCLTLNIYTTKLPKENESVKRPVVVFLHYGGLYSLGAASSILGPQYLLDEDIVLVTPNYRLGVLGFLATGDKDAPGNNGFKDQVQALEWLQENIEAFGGDPHAVTLAGYSAGALSVTHHLVSPLSRGLFHRAIAMSGSGLGQLPVPPNQLELAKRQAKLVGCPDDSSGNIVKCLKTKTAGQLGDSQTQLAEIGQEPVYQWSAVVEPDHGQPRFLPKHPISAIQSGEFNKVPVMIGLTTDEFGYRAFDVVRDEGVMKEFNEEWEKNAPIAFLYERSTAESKKISAGLKKFYLQDRQLDNASLASLAQLYADALTGWGVHNAANLLAKNSNESVYLYRFNYKGRYSHFYLPDSNGTIPYGVVHNDDMLYLFHSQQFPIFKDTDREAQVVGKLTNLWANFARTGNPTPEEVDILDKVTWEPYTKQAQKYLEIGNKLTVSQKLNEKRYAEWEKLFPNTKYSSAKAG